jgi:hypothetical protein
MSEDQKTEQEKRVAEAEAKAAETNATRTGKGTRVRVGQTRGRNPQVVSWEAFDESLTDTLPTTLDELTKLASIKDEATLVAYAIDGYNSAQYTAASDPIAEFVEASWPEDIQKNFRLVVRNQAAMLGVSIEDVVAMIKPQVVKALAAKKA